MQSSGETSYLWHLRPECVDAGILRRNTDEEMLGFCGTDPRREASIKIGREPARSSSRRWSRRRKDYSGSARARRERRGTADGPPYFSPFLLVGENATDWARESA